MTMSEKKSLSDEIRDEAIPPIFHKWGMSGGIALIIEHFTEISQACKPA